MPLSDEEAIRRELRAIIEETGSHGKAAKLLRVSRPTVTDFLNGGGLGPKMLAAVLHRSGKTLRELTHGTGPPAPVRRSITPAPSSSIRQSSREIPLPPIPPNRQQAIELLNGRGHSPDRIAIAIALAAFDSGLAAGEDPPVAWRIDAARIRLAESTG
jgi:hypothetical protein